PGRLPGIQQHRRPGLVERAGGHRTRPHLSRRRAGTRSPGRAVDPSRARIDAVSAELVLVPAWGLVAATPLALMARRASALSRVASLTPGLARRSRTAPGGPAVGAKRADTPTAGRVETLVRALGSHPASATVGRVLGARTRRRRDLAAAGELPV